MADAAFAARVSSAASSVSASPARLPRGAAEDATHWRNQPPGDDEAALVALKYSLAQNELREMVHALYSALETHEQQADASLKEAAQVKETHERWKQEARLEREQRRRQLQQCQHDLAWASQQMQQAQMQKGELEAETRWLKTQLEEKDKTIDRLNQQLAEHISKRHEGRQSGAVLVNELEQVAADFSRKEREVYSNMNHVREATTSLQQQGKDMRSEISSLQTQLADVKELYAGCRAFIAESRSPPLLDTKQPVASMRDDASRLEQESEDLKVENQALAQRCKHFGDELDDVQRQIAESVQENGALKKLVTKLEQSAEDGSQTIECLQDSLMKLCDQITTERQHHGKVLGDTIEAAREKEKQLAQDVERLQQKIHDIENRAEANTVSMILKRLEADVQTHNSEPLSRQNKTSQVSCEDRMEPRSIHQNTSSQTRAPAAAASRTLQRDSTPSIDESAEDIEDIEDDEVSTAGTPIKLRTTTTQAKTKPAATMCRSCGEEPFGFMVKCQKCKDPFHAGCVKPPNGKRRVSHVFKCSTCSLQRPTKVMRRENAPSVTPDVSRRPAVP